MTLAVESDDRRAVIGLDAGVEGLSSLIGELPLPSHCQLVLFDEFGTLLATDPKRLPSFEQLSRLPMLSALKHPILTTRDCKGINLRVINNHQTNRLTKLSLTQNA